MDRRDHTSPCTSAGGKPQGKWWVNCIVGSASPIGPPVERCSFGRLNGTYLPKDTSIWNLGTGFMWKGLCRCHYGKDPEKRSSSIRAALNPDTSIFTQDRRGEKAETLRGGPGGDGGRERGHASPTQGALSHQQPEGGSRREAPARVSLGVSRKCQSCQHLAFRLPVSRTVREKNVRCFKPPSTWQFLTAASGDGHSVPAKTVRAVGLTLP